MKTGLIWLCGLVLSGCASAAVPSRAPAQSPWETLSDGVVAAAFIPDFNGNSKDPVTQPLAKALETREALVVVRADLRRVQPVLLNKSELGFDSATADVALANGLVLATNASMFATDLVSSIGYMRNFAHVNHGSFNPKLKAFIAFHPKSRGLRAARIIEKSDPNWKQEIAQYDTVIETYRMLSSQGENQWKPGNANYYQVALMGLEKSGGMVFFFYPSRIDMYSLNEYIKTLPVDLEGLLYLDGDSKGVLIFKTPAGVNSLGYPGPLPNILGLAPIR